MKVLCCEQCPCLDKPDSMREPATCRVSNKMIMPKDRKLHLKMSPPFPSSCPLHLEALLLEQA